MNTYSIFNQTKRQRVSDGAIAPLLSGCESAARLLVLVWPQLGDFDSLEYAWWLQREAESLRVGGLRIGGSGNRRSRCGGEVLQLYGVSRALVVCRSHRRAAPPAGALFGTLLGNTGAICDSKGLAELNPDVRGHRQPRHFAGGFSRVLGDSDTWVFDDEKTGLMQEPFVSGMPEMIDILTHEIQNAARGFKLLFSDKPFPGYQAELVWLREEYEGKSNSF